MATCLVTKLKAAVRGDFPILGGLKLFLVKNRFSTTPIIYIGGVPGKVEIELLNTTLANGETKLTLTKNIEEVQIVDVGAPVELIATNPSYITYLGDLYDVSGGMANIPGENLQTLSLALTTVLDLNSAQNGNFQALQKFEVFSGTNNLTGNPENFFEACSTDVLNYIKFLAPKTEEFDISVLGKFTKLKTMDIADAPVVGTVESFVAGQRAAGRTTGSIQCGYKMGSKVTFDGTEIPVGDYSAKTLSWTATTITLGDQTINA